MNLATIERMVRDGDLSLDAIKYLIDCRGECEWLDFKQLLRLESDYDAAAFAKDAVAMRNTGGGYLVIGVQDKTWVPVGLSSELPYDAKLLRDKVRRATGLEISVDIIQHKLRYAGEPRWFAVILVRAAAKRRKRRTPSLVKNDFQPKESYGLRRGEIYFRRGDSTVRLDNREELEELLDDLEERADQDSLEREQSKTPFAVDTGTYRLLEKDFQYFVGRDQLRDQLISAVTKDPRIWIINVHGPGGVGKSALVTWAAYHFYAQREFEAILQLTAKETALTFGGISRSQIRTLYSLEGLLDQVLLLFGEEPPAILDDKKKLVLEWLSVWPTLIVLDNLETVDDGRIISFIQNLPPSSQAKVIITSRRKTGGWEHPVTVPELNHEETRDFVAVKSGELRIDLPLTERRINEINKACGGLPLAIQWTLGRYKLHGDLNQALDAVQNEDSPVLEFSFRNIWDVLSVDAKRTLSVMSIFEAPPGDNLLALATEIPRERLDSALHELEEATLVSRQVHPADGQATYSSLPITLSFAANQLARFSDLETGARRRVQQYTQQMELKSWEVERFVGVFERYGIEADSEKRGVILCRRGESETFSGNMDAAGALFKQARDVAPTSAYVFAMSASYELARNRIGEAIKFADVACARASRFTGGLAYSTKGRVCDAQRDKFGRVNALRRAVEYSPTDLVLLHQLGVALSRAGETTEAIDKFTEIITTEAARDVPSETLLMALKTRIINYRRVGLNRQAQEDLTLAKDLLARHPHLSPQAHHIAELE
ncbi:putative DNA binding domain-containing protein [Streptomyces sp. NBC_01317]|uniref:RNA-binding domain-containing protein n=1 Tax=Streptomyces sp. NBC_01317 TaxID=2903822 RepID=UPI002E0F4AA3|nr:putative DNA binding domain-containing protein [Streptomyces sp. NBC_01317]